jgi:hypothetical protein
MSNGINRSDLEYNGHNSEDNDNDCDNTTLSASPILEDNSYEQEINDYMNNSVITSSEDCIINSNNENQIIDQNGHRVEDEQHDEEQEDEEEEETEEELDENNGVLVNSDTPISDTNNEVQQEVVMTSTSSDLSTNIKSVDNIDESSTKRTVPSIQVMTNDEELVNDNQEVSHRRLERVGHPKSHRRAVSIGKQ